MVHIVITPTRGSTQVEHYMYTSRKVVCGSSLEILCSGDILHDIPCKITAFYRPGVWGVRRR